jgi:hypothetical protein
MVAASSSVRQVFTASQQSITRKTSLAAVSRRPVSSSAMALPLEDRPAVDLPIFDIFDAPSRLGESSRMLAQAVASRAERTCVPPTNRVQPAPVVQALPAPVIYDGPARPKGLLGGPRIRQIHSQAQHAEPRDQIRTLPPPVMFDGPSRLRPYVRDSASSEDSVSFPELCY